MMKDIDATDPLLVKYTGISPASYQSGLPTKKVHRDHRNALFFDLHVEKIEFDN